MQDSLLSDEDLDRKLLMEGTGPNRDLESLGLFFQRNYAFLADVAFKGTSVSTFPFNSTRKYSFAFVRTKKSGTYNALWPSGRK